MRKFKKSPKKPGWYVAWFDGVGLNYDSGINDKRNIFYWNGEFWNDHYGNRSSFSYGVYSGDDRWSYLPKDHSMRGKPAPQKR